jgi:hypothetical protein
VRQPPEGCSLGCADRISSVLEDASAHISRISRGRSGSVDSIVSWRRTPVQMSVKRRSCPFRVERSRSGIGAPRRWRPIRRRTEIHPTEPLPTDIANAGVGREGEVAAPAAEWLLSVRPRDLCRDAGQRAICRLRSYAGSSSSIYGCPIKIKDDARPNRRLGGRRWSWSFRAKSTDPAQRRIARRRRFRPLLPPAHISRLLR